VAGTDVVVVGSGAAGLSAAVAAATKGASVTVLEAADGLGGTTAISGGVVWAPGNPWAAREGVEDTLEQGLEYLHALDLGDVDPTLEATYVRQAVGVVEAVEQHTSLRWQHMSFPDYHAELTGGNARGRGLEIMPVGVGEDVLAKIRPDPYEVPASTLNEASLGKPDASELERREREGIATRGRGLVAGLLAALLERGGDVRTKVRATSLATSKGSVIGVEADGELHEGKVVIASGCF
jgi:3-oxosteroid 1-dehydrogenase